MLEIRKMRVSDIDDMEGICLYTAEERLRDTQKHCENTLYLYNRYYTRAERENCFVAVDKNDKAVGYIICAPDFKRYKNGFFKNELKSVFSLGIKYGVSAFFEVLAQKAVSKEYPAHLHIDIMPDYQGGGTGTALIHTLLAHLKEQNIKGIMLGVAKANEGAIRFYKRNGFTVLSSVGGGVIMVQKL